MKSNQLFVICFMVIASNLFSQFDPCNTGNEALCKCSTAPLITSKQLNDVLEVQMSPFLHAADGPTPLCSPPQGSSAASHNPTWISFVAISKQMVLTTIASECTDPVGQAKGGVQFILYRNCPASPIDAVQCDLGSDVCNGDGIRNVSYDNLEIGKKYYLLIDGCTGSSCKVRLQSNFCDPNLIIGKKNIVKIGGTLWSEYNSNSIFDNADKGVENIKLLLLSEVGEIIDSTSTDKNGEYLFSGHEEGCYFISLNNNFGYLQPLRYLVSCEKFSSSPKVDNDNNIFLPYDISANRITQMLSFIYPDDLSDTIIDMNTDFCLKLNCTQSNTNAKPFANQTNISCKFTDFNGPICSALKPIGNNRQTIKYKQKEITLYNPDFFSFVPDGRNFIFGILNYGCVVGERCAQVGIIDSKTNSCTMLDTIDNSEYITYNAIDFIVGRRYYFFVSGCDGSLCNYDFAEDINGLSTVNDLKIECSNPSNIICINEKASIKVEGFGKLMEGEFVWRIYDKNTGGITYDTTEVSELPIFQSFTGQYNVQLIRAEGLCPFNYTANYTIEYSVEDNSTCEKLLVVIDKVHDVGCTEKGYIVLKVSQAQEPVTYFVNNQPTYVNNDTLYIEKSGFKNLKVVDGTGFSRSYDIWVGGDSLFEKHDLVPTLVIGAFQRGVEQDAWLNLSNLSCQKVDALLVLELPKEMTFMSSDIPPATSNGQILTWEYPNFTGKKSIKLKLKTLQSASLDSTIKVKVEAYPIETDHRPSDNKKEYAGIVTGSYDPNDKKAYPYGICPVNYVLKDERIEYTIRFQNIGTAPARTVVVVDPIDEYHDQNSIKVLATSHDYYLSRSDNQLHFHFNNILLPSQSEDSVLSNGFVVFSINTKKNIVTPASSVNYANIFFDENQPITTNYTYYTFVDTIPRYELQSDYTCGGVALFINGIEYSSDTSFVVESTASDGCKTIETNTVKLDKTKLTVIVQGPYMSCVEYFEKYLWIDCRNSGATFETLDSVFIPPYSGDFKIIGFEGDCKWESDCTPIMTSTKEINTPQINIFPNPSFNGEVIITSANSEILDVQLISIDGKKNMLSNLIMSKEKWELKDVGNGLFIIQVLTNIGTSAKLIEIIR